MAPTPHSPSARELAARIDHTLLAPAATPADIERLCAEARQHSFATVCINGIHVRRAADLLRDSDVRVCSVVGFPLGANDPAVKAAEAARALEQGAHELDMVLQIGALRAADHALVLHDITAVVTEAHQGTPPAALVKVILETGLLTEPQIRTACTLLEKAGADFAKTSTGLGPRGATPADIELMRSCLGPNIAIKAAGGIRSAAFARELLAAGAQRLGTSASLAILAEA